MSSLLIRGNYSTISSKSPRQKIETSGRKRVHPGNLVIKVSNMTRFFKGNGTLKLFVAQFVLISKGGILKSLRNHMITHTV